MKEEEEEEEKKRKGRSSKPRYGTWIFVWNFGFCMDHMEL